MVELFFRYYLDLCSQIDFNIVYIILSVHNSNPKNSQLLIEMLSVLAVLTRNNRRFEQGLIQNKDFSLFINHLTDEKNE